MKEPCQYHGYEPCTCGRTTVATFGAVMDSFEKKAIEDKSELARLRRIEAAAKKIELNHFNGVAWIEGLADLHEALSS